MSYTEYTFGSDLVFHDQFLVNERTKVPSEITFAGIYSSSPTDAQIAAESGAIETLQSSEERDLGYELTFDPIDDPDVYSSNDYEIYYKLVKFRWKATEQVQHVVNAFLLWRPDSIFSRIVVTAPEIYAMESKMVALKGANSTWAEGHIKNATDVVKNALKAKGYNRRRQFALGDMNLATKFFAAALCCLDLAGEGNQFWMQKHDKYAAMYQQIWNNSSIGYDVDDDGVPEPNERTAEGGSNWLLR